MFHAFFLSLGVIFVAELGDKSQLMALAFATRYKTLPVLIGITLATALVHLASVGIGAMLGAALPTRPINAVAALAFVGFGLWTLRGDELTIEFEGGAAPEVLSVHRGMAGWDDPEPRVHRAINSGSETYEELVTFLLPAPDVEPQPERIEPAS